MGNCIIKGWTQSVTKQEFPNGGKKTTWIMKGTKCVSWSWTIYDHLTDGMEIDILDFDVKTEQYTKKDGGKVYLDNRVVVHRIKLLSRYDKDDFVGIEDNLGIGEIEELNEEFTKPIKEHQKYSTEEPDTTKEEDNIFDMFEELKE